MPTALAPPCNEIVAQGRAEVPAKDRHGTLVATVLASSLAMIVGSVINVALPSIQQDFATDAAGVQWIVNSYLLPVSSLVLLGGALGDRKGRKRLFLVGLAIFFLATLGCSLAVDLNTLLAMRFIQGLGAALIAPNSLAILAQAYTGADRGKAIGTWAAASTIAGAAAPLLGGMLVDQLDWRWAFAIVLPPAVAAMLIGFRAIADDVPDNTDSPMDFLGGTLATLFLAAAVFSLINLPELGWRESSVVGSAVAGAVFLLGFLWIENRKQNDALVPPAIFKSRSFTGISILTMLLYAALGGFMVLFPYVLITGLSYSATEAGAALLPLPLMMGLLSRSIGAAAPKLGIRSMLTAGPALVAAGFALLAGVPTQDITYARDILPALLVISSGMAITVAPLTTAVMSAVENRFVGVASGINNAISRTAGLIATALLGLVLVRGNEGTENLIGGFAASCWVGAMLAATAAIVSVLMIRNDELKQ